jgi:hypothetical protein
MSFAMKMNLFFVSLLLPWPCVAQQTSTGQNPTPAPAAKFDQSQAHDSVMDFLRGLRIAELPEGKQLLLDAEWLPGTGDRPDYTEATSLFRGLFDTDVAPVKAYKELFDIKAVTKAGTIRNLKYLVISFRDSDSGKWKIFSPISTDSDESATDVEYSLAFFRAHLADDHSVRSNYYNYATWLVRSGRIKEAKSALETAKAPPQTSTYEPAFLPRIDALLTMIAKVAPNVEGNKQ